MKKTILFSTLLASSVALATDWPTLITLAPTLQKETINLDTKGLIKADVAKLPSGKYRFLGFSSFLSEKKPIVTIEADPDTNLKELCQDSVFFDKKKFKAQLTIQTNPMATNDRPMFGAVDLNDFDNPVTVGAAKISFSKKSAAWSLHDVEAMDKSKGRQVSDYYEELLNAQLQQSSNGVVRMDLSKMNAFACDLAQGFLVLSVTRTADYEAGLPMKENWVGLEQYTTIFKGFWSLQPQVVDARLPKQQNDLAEAVALGVAARRTDVTEELLKSPARLQKFMASVKADARGLNQTQKAAIRTTEITGNWMMNSEYTKPATTSVKQNLVVSEEPAFTKLED